METIHTLTLHVLRYAVILCALAVGSLGACLLAHNVVPAKVVRTVSMILGSELSTCWLTGNVCMVEGGLDENRH